MTIVTHRNPDMDALVSVFIILNEEDIDIADVEFRSAYDGTIDGATYLDLTPRQPVSETSPQVIDHHYGRLTSLVTSEQVWRLYGCKPEYRLLVEEAGIQDRSLDRKRPGVRFRDVFLAVRTSLIENNTYTDKEFAILMFQMFEAVVAKEHKLLDAVNDVKDLSVSYVEEGRFSIAYYEGRATPYVGQYLFGREGVNFIIYRDGNNTGVTRNAEMDRPSLTMLKRLISREAKDQASEWFYHADGFLACRGTYKNPARSVPNIGLTTLVNLLMLFLRTEG